MIVRISASFTTGLLLLVPSLIGYFGSWLRWTDFNFEVNHGEYDFVIVGGGSAGCVVAARLSENPQNRVLLLESGGSPNPFSYVPLAAPFLQNNPATDWEHKTVPLHSSTLSKPLSWPRGNGLGGSSATNFMIYMRGNPRDFDEWENITGDSRWGYKNVEKYFKKMEDYHGRYEREFHGKNGPLRVEPVNYAPGLDNFLEAVKETGFSVRDLNVDQQEGFSPVEFTQKRGIRLSAYSAYIQPILDRPNLKILRYSHATKIHFDSNLKASGVSFVRKGQTMFAAAQKEVIVSSGTINSAQLLLLSGIGPAKHLRNLGIKPLVDLPVGQNLLDHVMTIVGPFTLNETSASFTPTKDISLKSLADFVISGTGPVTSPLGVISVGVTSTSSSSPEWPNLLHVISSVGSYDRLGATIDGMFGTADYFSKFLHSLVGFSTHYPLLALGKPKSKGFIELQDSNPFSKPIINPQYYSDKGNQDLQDMVEGYKMVVNLYENSNSLGSKLGARLIENPTCAKYGFKTRAYYECVIMTPTLTIFHPVGTCAMGKIGDPKAVLDSQLRVIGTNGLRVIDASVMPTITNANTNAPTIMIGELGADLIKNS